MTNWKKFSLVSVSVLLTVFSHAQQFRFRSNLDTVASPGFYAIPITPELSSHLKTDFSDLRIADAKGHWVPHLVRFTTTGAEGLRVVNLKMTSTENLGTNSVILIENPEKYLLSEFVLRLKNAAAQRMASLSGSEDNKRWYIIADSLLVSRSDSHINDENLKVISFPPTQYHYYKLTIRNDKKDPLNILAISSNISGTPNSEKPFVENPTPGFTQLDSGKLTLIKVTHDKPYHFDQFRIKVTSPALYDRTARIFLELKPGLINTWESHSVTEIKLSSNNPRSPSLPPVKAKTFYIMISNQDNPPLEIKAVNTFQESKQAIAYLEKNKPYHLLLENPEARPPEYDLKQFDKNIPEKLEDLQVGQLIAINNPVLASTKKPGDWWIWATIAGIILVLAYLTWGLTKDMHKKKEIV